ncbi:MAG: hypothetical protein ACLSBB_18405 [Ruthenibacterium lactatiformans]
MKKQRREKSDRYRSIGQKQMTVLIVSVLLSILLFSGYFFFSVRQNSVQEYVQRSENAVDVSVHNIDYYIENCISSARSIYVDNDIVSLLSQNSRGPLTTGQMEQIYSYLQTLLFHFRFGTDFSRFSSAEPILFIHCQISAVLGYRAFSQHRRIAFFFLLA